MPETTIHETVPLGPEEAFDIYVNHINTWWPRQGVFPYSFAPKTTLPQHIQFEARLNGRYYETFADNSEYVIGHIKEWHPPQFLAYTWRDPSWQGDTLISVKFTPVDIGTLVTCEQDGFAAAGVPDLIPYYHIGNRQTLAGFIAHCQAIFELKEKGLSFS